MARVVTRLNPRRGYLPSRGRRRRNEPDWLIGAGHG